MPHPYSNALYYPTIDISNTEWLKTTVLFWDSISTIVPESLDNPYQENDTRFLSENGFLKPLRINSNDDDVIDIGNEIIELLSSPEIIQSFFYESNVRHTKLYRSKMSLQFEEILCEIRHRPIYAEKLPMHLRMIIDEVKKRGQRGFYYVDDLFAASYMTLLANKLSERYSLAMITDTHPFFTAGNSIKYGNQSCMLIDRHASANHRYHELAQGILLNYIIRGLSISPETTLDDLIRFKEHHRDELGRFKVELANLTQTYEDTNEPIDAIQNEIKDIYENKFLPAYNALKDALSGFNIRWITNSFLKISAISASAAGVPVVLLGLPIEQALYAGMGISVIASSVSYNVDKRQFLRDNPYSYLLSIRREW